MMLAAVNLITAVPGAASASVTHSLAGQANRTAASSPSAKSSSFADLITDAIGQMTQLEAHVQTTGSSPITCPMTGFGTDMHHRMIATQKADTAFELGLAARNEAVQAYQSVMAMQF
jgi:flagellar hook-basal body complex protein FliE